MEIGDDIKDLENAGRLVATVRSSVAVPELPASDVRSPLVLVCVPTTEDVTFTVTVQLSDGAICPSLSEIEFASKGALNIAAAPHVVDAEPSAIVIAAGILSVNARSATGDAELFVIVNVSVDTDPDPIVSGKKTLSKDGAADCAAACWPIPAA